MKVSETLQLNTISKKDKTLPQESTIQDFNTAYDYQKHKNFLDDLSEPMRQFDVNHQIKNLADTNTSTSLLAEKREIQRKQLEL